MTKRRQRFLLRTSWALLLSVSLALTGCSSSKFFQRDGAPDSTGVYGNQPTPRIDKPASGANKPYTVMGKRYYPITGDQPMNQTGIASWYGKQFHGKKTSTGETYNMYSMTAAHKTMELPSYAKVTNLQNGRSLIVRVNDRGPFVGSRIIDMSYGAAVKLGFAGKGTANVRVERITRSQIARGDIPKTTYSSTASTLLAKNTATELPSTPTTTKPIAVTPTPVTVPSASTAISPSTQAAADDGMAGVTPDAVAKIEKQIQTLNASTAANAVSGWFVQIGAFRSEGNAEEFLAHAQAVLSANDSEAPVRLMKDGGYYRVLVGQAMSVDTARTQAKKIGQFLGLQAFPIQKRIQK